MVRADKGFITYRYHGPYGAIMIGAHNDVEALNEAKRSLSSGETPSLNSLERWNGEQWINCDEACELADVIIQARIEYDRVKDAAIAARDTADKR